MPNWTFDTIRFNTSRQFVNPFGESSRSPLCGSGATCAITQFTQWRNTALAGRWRQRAKSLRDQNHDAWYQGTCAQTLDHNQAYQQYLDQCKYVSDLANAIAQFYNALNVPWHLHYAARQLYWTYMSGHPVGTSEARMFSRDSNMCAGWFRQGTVLPVVTDESTGTIPRFARQLYVALVTGERKRIACEFVPSVAMTQTIDPATWNGDAMSQAHKERLVSESNLFNSFTTETSAANIALVSGMQALTRYGMPGAYGIGQIDSIMALRAKISDLCDTGSYAGLFNVIVNANRAPYAFPYNQVCSHGFYADYVGWAGDTTKWALGMTRCDPRREYPDWRMFVYDEAPYVGPIPSLHMTTWLGPQHYMQWLSDWVDLIMSTTYDEVCTSTREFAMWWNARAIANSRSINDILLAPGSQFTEASTRDPAVMAAGGIVMAAGAALAGVTYGISTVVAAAASVVMDTVSRIPSSDRITAGRDDLGRFKPFLEHSWLSGNPADSVYSQGAPAFDVPEPDGAVATSLLNSGRYRDLRLVRSLAERAQAQSTRSTNASDTSESGASGSGGMLLIGGAAAAFLGWKLLKRRAK